MSGIGVLLLRCGSKGLHLKNILILNGRPLAYYTIDFMLSDDRVEKVVVSSDCDEILDCIKEYPSDRIVLHKRSSLNSNSRSSSEDALVEVLDFYDKKYESDFDFVLYAQATEPLRPQGLLSKAINLFYSEDVESVFAAFIYHKNFWSMEGDNMKLITKYSQSNLPRQIKQPVFREDTGVCLISTPEVIRSGRRIGDSVAIVPYEHIGALIDIHSKSDLLLAGYLMKYQDELDRGNC